MIVNQSGEPNAHSVRQLLPPVGATPRECTRATRRIGITARPANLRHTFRFTVGDGEWGEIQDMEIDPEGLTEACVGGFGGIENRGRRPIPRDLRGFGESATGGVEVWTSMTADGLEINLRSGVSDQSELSIYKISATGQLEKYTLRSGFQLEYHARLGTLGYQPRR